AADRDRRAVDVEGTGDAARGTAGGDTQVLVARGEAGAADLVRLGDLQHLDLVAGRLGGIGRGDADQVGGGGGGAAVAPAGRREGGLGVEDAAAVAEGVLAVERRERCLQGLKQDARGCERRDLALIGLVLRYT